MDNKEIKKIEKMIQELDTAAGMLIVSAMGNKEVMKAMEKISKVSFDLGNMV